jgi:hypothetical protein
VEASAITPPSFSASAKFKMSFRRDCSTCDTRSNLMVIGGSDGGVAVTGMSMVVERLW